ncbi:MAG: hypothetical protein PEPC_01645 [Peptostreptococcus russellii]
MCEPKISVVIPAYNHPELLYKTIESVLRQTFSDFEVLIIDDGSEMDLTETISHFSYDPRLRYTKITHSNANVARNYGIQSSKGEFIAMLDSDDLWLDTHLEQCLRSLGSSDGLYGSLILRYSDPDQDRIVYTRNIHKDELMINFLLFNGYAAQTSTLFMTASSAKDIMWDPSLNRHQDYDFVVRYSKKYNMIALHDPSVICQRINKNVIIDFESCIAFIRKFQYEIDPMIYVLYNFDMLKLARSYIASGYDVNPGIIHHYKTETVKYLYYLSYRDYLYIMDPMNRFQIFKSILRYIVGILNYRIEI